MGEPRTVQSPQPLDAAERRRVWWAVVLPVPVVVVLLLPFVIFGDASFAAVVGSALVYGSLLSLASGFVAVDRLQHKQCPACRERNGKGAMACAHCSYDLQGRPRFACDQRHRVHLDPGMCACGRRLQPLPGSGGIGHEILIILRIGAWMLAFLVGMGLLFQFAG